MKIAQIQFSPVLGDEEASLDNLRELIFNTRHRADLIILPELANSGYNFPNRDFALKLAKTVEESEFIDWLRRWALMHETNIVTGFLEKDGDDLFNSAVYINKKGKKHIYRKVHLFMNEKNIFKKGNLGFPVFDINGYKLGILICFDYLFPEAWRILALKGADIIAHPSNLVTYNAFKVVPAQAVINRYFIFTTNRTGIEDNLSFAGKSFAVNINGETISKASPDKQEVIFSKINPTDAKNKMITEQNHVLKDRFPELYTELINLKV
jgi:predicted amidohydrolase